MADTSNLTSFLTDIADAIRTKTGKTENILASEFDNEILALSSTSAGGVKHFTTEEEMQSDATAKEGDLAIIYFKSNQNWDGTSSISTMTFPKTVVLPSASTGYCYGYASGDTYVDIQGDVSETSANFRIYGDNSYNITYTSTDGLTYTRTDTYDETITISSESVTITMYEWMDVCGYFMQVMSSNFNGLYAYDGSAWSIAPNQFTLTKKKMLPGIVGYGKNGVITGTDGIYELLDYDLINSQTLNKGNAFELVVAGPISPTITPGSSRKAALKTQDYLGFHNTLDLYVTPDTTLCKEELVNESTINLTYAYFDYDTRRIYAPVATTRYTSPYNIVMNVLDMDTGEILNSVKIEDSTDLASAGVYNSFKVDNYIYIPVSVNSSTSSKDAGVKLYKYDIVNNTLSIQYKVTSVALGGSYNTTATYVGGVDKSGNIYALVLNSSTYLMRKITLLGSFTNITTFSNITTFGRTIFPSKYVMIYDSTNLLFAYNVETNNKVLIPVDYSGGDSSGAPKNIKIFEAGENTIILAKYLNDLYLAIIDKDENVRVKYQSSSKVSNSDRYVTNTVPSIYFEEKNMCFVSASLGMVCVDMENVEITSILEVGRPMYDLQIYKNYIEYKSIGSNKLYHGKCIPIIVEPLLSSDFFGYKNNGKINIRQSDLTRLFAEPDYVGTIAPEEYNTAIDTATEILGEEV